LKVFKDHVGLRNLEEFVFPKTFAKLKNFLLENVSLNGKAIMSAAKCDAKKGGKKQSKCQNVKTCITLLLL